MDDSHKEKKQRHRSKSIKKTANKHGFVSSQGSSIFSSESNPYNEQGSGICDTTDYSSSNGQYDGELVAPLRLQFTPSVSGHTSAKQNDLSNSLFNFQPSAQRSNGSENRNNSSSQIVASSFRNNNQQKQVSFSRHPRTLSHFVYSSCGRQLHRDSFCRGVIEKLINKKDRHLRLEYMRISSAPSTGKNTQVAQDHRQNHLVMSSDGSRISSILKNKGSQTNNGSTQRISSKQTDKICSTSKSSQKSVPRRVSDVVENGSSQWIVTELSKKKPEVKGIRTISTAKKGSVTGKKHRRSTALKDGNEHSSGNEKDKQLVLGGNADGSKATETNILQEKCDSDISVVDQLYSINSTSPNTERIVQEIENDSPRVPVASNSLLDLDKSRESQCNLGPTINKKNILQPSKSLFAIPVLSQRKELPLKKTKSINVSRPSQWLVDAACEMERIQKKNIEIGKSAASMASTIAHSSAPSNNGACSVNHLKIVGLDNDENAKSSSYKEGPSYNHLMKTDMRMLLDSKPYALSFDVNFDSKNKNQPEVKLLELVINNERVFRCDSNLSDNNDADTDTDADSKKQDAAAKKP